MHKVHCIFALWPNFKHHSPHGLIRSLSRTYVGKNVVGNGHFFFLDVEHTTINIPQMTWHRETHRKPSEEYSISSNVESGFLQDMKPGLQRVRSLANSDLRVRTWNPVHRESEVWQNLDLRIRTWTPVHRESEVWQILDLCVRTWNPVHRDSQDWQKLDLHVRTWNPVHGNSHSRKTWISVSGHETRSTWQIDVLLFLPRVRFTQNHPIFTRNWMYQIWM